MKNRLKMDNIRPRAQIKFVACWLVYPKWARYESIPRALTFFTYVWASSKFRKNDIYFLTFFSVVCVNIHQILVRYNGPRCTLNQCPYNCSPYPRVLDELKYMNLNECQCMRSCDYIPLNGMPFETVGPTGSLPYFACWQEVDCTDSSFTYYWIEKLPLVINQARRWGSSIIDIPRITLDKPLHLKPWHNR